MGTGNNSVTSNNIKLVHYTGRWWIDCYISKEGPGWAPPSPLLAVPNVTAHPSTACVPITALLNNGPLLCGCNVPIKGLICCTSIWCWQEVVTTHSWRMQLLITHCESLNRLCECEDGSDELRNILTPTWSEGVAVAREQRQTANTLLEPWVLMTAQIQYLLRLFRNGEPRTARPNAWRCQSSGKWFQHRWHCLMKVS